MFMMAMIKNSNKIFLFVIIIITISSKSIHGNQAYFDLSDNEIEIQTNFNGKEVIIFGLTEPELNTILTIKGPTKNKNNNYYKKKYFIRIFKHCFHRHFFATL